MNLFFTTSCYVIAFLHIPIMITAFQEILAPQQINANSSIIRIWKFPEVVRIWF